ncbi:hypothetical protein [Glycomyces terrestris]|uniref:Prenyltransferase n=1 Tax=Glycomyces terrestris TaxID=2493553 RepID=A0A426UVK6_9ACTN|nr:hypothetical protein [Glycomyces terrestris]RRR98350.1 hypothetical protein EIW28_15725 [Glycomyces terrestris]
MGFLEEAAAGRAAQFVWRTGGLVDQRRMALLTGAGTAAGVREAVLAHRTGDGGFAFAIEPDVKGPQAQPLSAMSALEILAEAGVLDQATGAGVCDWLARHTAADGGVPDLLASIAAYPHPPWVQAPPQDRGGLLTTARTAGVLRAAGVEHAWIEGAAAFARARIDALEATHPYEAFSIIAFLGSEPDRAWADRAAARVRDLVRDTCVVLDPARMDEAEAPAGYAPGEHHVACDFAPGPESAAAAWFTAAELRASLEHLAGEQAGDGGWPIHYRRWHPGIEQQARPGFTVRAVRTLRAWEGRV